MVSRTERPETQKRALVVQRCPNTRRQICAQLIDRGFQVDACATPEEGRLHFRAQDLVIATTETDSSAPSGFIAWLRQHTSKNGAAQPYIMAVGDREASLLTPAPNRAWDELLTTPLNDANLRGRIEAVESLVENRLANGQRPILPLPTVPRIDPATTRTAIRPLTPPQKPAPILRVPPPPAAARKRLAPQIAEPARQRQPLPPPTIVPPPPAAALGNPPENEAPIHPAPSPQPPKPAAPAAADLAPAVADAIFDLVQPISRPPGSNGKADPLLGHFQALIDNAPVSMALFDLEMRYLVVNQEWLTSFGMAGSKLIGKSHYDVFPNLGPAWRRVYQRALQGHGERCEEDLWVRADGSQDWVRWDVKPWRGADGQIAGLSITCEVINEMIAHQNRGDVYEVGRSLLSGKVTPVVCVDLDGKILEASEACLAYLPEADLRINGELFWEVFSLDPGRDKLKREFYEAARETRGGEGFAFPPSWSHPARLAAGGQTSLVWSNSPRYDADGRITGVLCIGIPQDDLAKPAPPRRPVIEPEPEPEPEPENPQQLLESPPQPEMLAGQASLLEQASFGVILLDQDRNTLYSNAEHSRLLGFDVRQCADIEDWLRQAAPESSNVEMVIESWRENVWRRRVTKTFTLRNREKALREIEFRPRPTAEGGLMITLFDVTEKRRGEDALRASEAKFRALFQHVGVGIALEDRSGNFFDVNPLFERMADAGRHEILKTGVRDWIHPDDWPAIEAQAGRQRNGEPAAAVEVRLNQKTGGLLWSRTTISRVTDQSGRAIFTAYVFHDITNERRVDATLEVAREEHRALLGAVPDLILMLDREGRVLDLIPSAAGYLIGDPAAAIGRPLAELAPGLGDRVPQLIARAASREPVAFGEFHQSEESGFDRHFEARFVRCGDDRFVAVIQDVTASRRANQALLRHALVFDHHTDGLIIADLAGKIVDFNAASEELFGYSEAQILGQTLSTLFSPTDRASFNRRVADALSMGKWAETTTFRRADGTEGRCEVYYVAVPGEGDVPPSIVGINRRIRRGAAPAGNGDSVQALRHRLRADLKTVIDIIGIQLSFTNSTDLRHALRQNQERIRAIALIHQLLESTGSPKVEIASYLKAVRRSVLQDFNVSPEEIAVRLDCPEIELTPSQALAVGLITSEFLSETLRDACTHGRTGAIKISLSEFKSFIEFRIEDAGLEIPDSLKHLDGSDLNIEIIKTLAENLDAELSLVASPLPALSLRFPVAGESEKG